MIDPGEGGGARDGGAAGGPAVNLSDLEIAAILGDIMIAGGGSTGDGIESRLCTTSSLRPHTLVAEGLIH